ncbi:hypothetical protein LXL04_033555 [Taraxacum kok-saghyz]
MEHEHVMEDDSATTNDYVDVDVNDEDSDDSIEEIDPESQGKATTSESASSHDNNARQSNVGGVPIQNNILEEFDEYDNDDLGSTTTTQLQVYLLEPRAKRTSHVHMLDFWKSQQYSLGGRILNAYRSSMSSDTVEAIVCTRDWLFGEKVDLNDAVDNLTKSGATPQSQAESVHNLGSIAFSERVVLIHNNTKRSFFFQATRAGLVSIVGGPCVPTAGGTEMVAAGLELAARPRSRVAAMEKGVKQKGAKKKEKRKAFL